MSAVELCGIEKSLGGQTVLQDLSFQVDAGQYVVLLGPSGCGKTTTLRIIAGLEKAERGRVMLDGRDATGVAPRRRDVSMVFQNDSLYPHLTIGESIGFGLKNKVAANEINQRVHDAAELVGIGTLLDRMPHQVSGGQLRRAAIAKAIARRAAVRLLDEPLSAIDAPQAYEIQEDLLRWHEMFPGTIIHVTHDGGEAMRMADRIAVMENGTLTQFGTPDEIHARPSTLSVARAVGLPPVNLFEAKLSSGHLSFSNELIQHRGRFGNSSIEMETVAGIRPEAWKIVNVHDGQASETDGLIVKAKLHRLRPVEGGLLAIFRIGADEVTLTADGSRALTIGDDYTLLAPAERVLNFEAASGRRIDA